MCFLFYVTPLISVVAFKGVKIMALITHSWVNVEFRVIDQNLAKIDVVGADASSQTSNKIVYLDSPASPNLLAMLRLSLNDIPQRHLGHALYWKEIKIETSRTHNPLRSGQNAIEFDVAQNVGIFNQNYQSSFAQPPTSTELKFINGQVSVIDATGNYRVIEIPIIINMADNPHAVVNLTCVLSCKYCNSIEVLQVPFDLIFLNLLSIHISATALAMMSMPSLELNEDGYLQARFPVNLSINAPINAPLHVSRLLTIDRTFNPNITRLLTIARIIPEIWQPATDGQSITASIIIQVKTDSIAEFQEKVENLRTINLRFTYQYRPLEQQAVQHLEQSFHVDKNLFSLSEEPLAVVFLNSSAGTNIYSITLSQTFQQVIESNDNWDTLFAGLIQAAKSLASEVLKDPTRTEPKKTGIRSGNIHAKALVVGKVTICYIHQQESPTTWESLELIAREIQSRENLWEYIIYCVDTNRMITDNNIKENIDEIIRKHVP